MTQPDRRRASDHAQSGTTNTDILVHLARMEGQMSQLMQLQQMNHETINQRLQDVITNTNTRFDGLEKRMGAVEDKERGTAIRAAASGAVSGAVAAAALAALKLGMGH